MRRVKEHDPVNFEWVDLEGCDGWALSSPDFRRSELVARARAGGSSRWPHYTRLAGHRLRIPRVAAQLIRATPASRYPAFLPVGRRNPNRLSPPRSKPTPRARSQPRGRRLRFGPGQARAENPAERREIRRCFAMLMEILRSRGLVGGASGIRTHGTSYPRPPVCQSQYPHTVPYVVDLVREPEVSPSSGPARSRFCPHQSAT